jgi:hypothetical protein
MSMKQFLVAASIGAVITYSLVFFLEDNSESYNYITGLENRITELETELAKKNQGTNMVSPQSFSAPINSNAANKITALSNTTQESNLQPESTESTGLVTQDSQQILKDLATRNDFNPRTFSERVNDFLSENPGKESIALAAKAVVDMADNSEALSNFELEAVYQKQNDPDLKRVTAQVLSMRGDNSLLEKQIVDAQSGLRSDNPEARQKALVELAKTRYAGAANAIAPLLQDKNTAVKLDALLALRSTGNESHLHLVQGLVDDPDPSVSWLAKDVMDNLQYLSERARTRVSTNDIVAELPPVTE